MQTYIGANHFKHATAQNLQTFTSRKDANIPNAQKHANMQRQKTCKHSKS